MKESMVVRKCETLEEFQNCVTLQREIWGEEDLEIEPTTMFVVASLTGGQEQVEQVRRRVVADGVPVLPGAVAGQRRVMRAQRDRVALPSLHRGQRGDRGRELSEFLHLQRRGYRPDMRSGDRRRGARAHRHRLPGARSRPCARCGARVRRRWSALHHPAGPSSRRRQCLNHRP